MTTTDDSSRPPHASSTESPKLHAPSSDERGQAPGSAPEELRKPPVLLFLVPLVLIIVIGYFIR
jgi:hypothetical protein